jgi:hypothetical protein
MDDMLDAVSMVGVMDAVDVAWARASSLAVRRVSRSASRVVVELKRHRGRRDSLLSHWWLVIGCLCRRS